MESARPSLRLADSSKTDFTERNFSMKQKTKKVFSVILLACYLIALYFMLDYMTGYPILILVTAFASFLFMAFTHELGHLLFGLLTGYQFIFFRIFALTLIKENGKFRFCRMSASGTGGQCLMAPPKKENGKYPFVLYQLGGILLCGFLSLVPIALSAFLTSAHSILGMCLFLFGFISFVSNLLNAIPTNGKGMINDATNLQLALQSPSARDALWNQLSCYALRANNVRTADMPEALFFLPEKKDLGNALLIRQALADIERDEDLGNYEKARSSVYFVLDHAPCLHPMDESALQTEAVFLDSLLGYGSARTATFYEKNKNIKALQKAPSFLRASYAYFSLYKKDSEKSKQAQDKLQKALKNLPFPTDITFEQRQMKYIETIVSADS